MSVARVVVTGVYQLDTQTVNEGTRWRGWLRHCVTSRKVAGSISDSVIGIIH